MNSSTMMWLAVSELTQGGGQVVGIQIKDDELKCVGGEITQLIHNVHSLIQLICHSL